MAMTTHARIQDYVVSRLSLHGDIGTPGDDEPLFSSARLDSLDAVELVIFLEASFGVDFARLGFNLTLLDTVHAITALAEREAVAG